MKILVLGGDGFCGWPTSLNLSNSGHEVLIIDNLSRRNIDNELGVSSLTPIQSVQTRINTWNKNKNNQINFINIDIAHQYSSLLNTINEFKPETIIHFAEQRAAPYSMKTPQTKRYTVDNNINATHNLLCAIVESKLDIHLVHLGTMGVYGYGTAGMKIPEGYLDVHIKDDENQKMVETQILYPTNPGSIYHMTKSLDQIMFGYYAKNNHLKITDLHQGIVWGTQTTETRLDENLINRFDYDGDYGTVLNRFLVQSALNFPLTVHGTGGQTRAFIHIEDSMKCIEIAISNPPKKGQKPIIRNQMTETHKVRDLAKLISDKTGTKIDNVENPRNEDAENELFVSNKSFIDLGLKPKTLDNSLLEEVEMISKKYQDRIDIDMIPCKSLWK